MEEPLLVTIICLLLARPAYGVVGGSLVISNFEEELLQISIGATGVTNFQDYLDDSTTFTRTALNASTTVSQLSASLESQFSARFEIIRNLKTKIEAEFASFTASSSYKACCSVSTAEENYNSNFRTQVDTEAICHRTSGGSGDVQKHATAAVLEQFKQNMEAVGDVKFQYFGGSDGVLSAYPAWKVDDCESYDPRFRPWYVATASPFPKDVVIVIDNSNGMGDSKLGGELLSDVAKEAAGIALDTLNGKDRVAVVAFAEEAYTPELLSHTCFSTSLAVASSPNKAELKGYINDLVLSSSSKYSVGLAKAFELMTEENFDSERRRVILFISGTSPTDTVDEMKAAIRTGNANLNNSVSVLTYGIGSPVASGAVTALEAIISESQVTPGVYSPLSDIDTLKTDMGSFYSFFVPTDFDTPIISPPYYDAFGLGTITTVTLPVFNSGDFVGVVGIDVTLVDLLSDVLVSSSASGYPFIFDIVDKHTLIHPLLPNPGEISVDPMVFPIGMLEPNDAVNPVIDAMSNGESGTTNFTTAHYYANGDPYREGVSAVHVNSFFSYQQVPGTTFAVCYVLKVDSTSSECNLRTALDVDSIKFVYHRLDLQSDLINCKRFYRVSSQDASSVKFAPSAFLDQGTYTDNEETAEDIDKYTKIINGEEENDLFNAGVVNDVHVTTQMDTEWKAGGSLEPSVVTHAVWRYIGTQRGVIRIFPAVQLNNNYDPRTRPWYKRALANPTKYMVSAPYLDAFGAGYILTMSETIYETGTTDIYGVMATDLTVHYLYYLMTKIFFDCDQEGTECFMMDSAGYIVIHKSWIHGEWQETPKVSNVHITSAEPFIADHMIQQGYFARRVCNNLYHVREQTFFEVSFTEVDHSDDENAWYRAAIIPNSNLYMIIKDTSQTFTNEHNCICGDESVISPPECISQSNNTCECPCFRRAEFESCTNTYLGDSFKPCTPVNELNVVADVDEDSDDIKSLEWCDLESCSRKRNRGECDTVAMCRWCDRDVKGSEVNPYCGEYAECYFGQIGHPSPYAVEGGSTPTAAIAASVTVVAVAAAAVGGVVAVKSGMIAIGAGAAAAGAGGGGGAGGAGAAGLVAGA